MKLAATLEAIYSERDLYGLRDCLRALSQSDEFKVRHGSGVAQADNLLRELGEL